MAVQRIHIIRNQRFSCIQCGECCRRWHVALFPDEAERLRALDWDGEPGFAPGNPVHLIGGHPFLAHRADGDCLFLDSQANLCRIHRRFGEAVKPLGCRVYPLNVAATYGGEATVSVRMDCPAVRMNHGPFLSERRRETEKLTRELRLRGGFGEEHLDDVSRQSVEFILDSLRRGILAREDMSPAVRNLALLFAVARLEQLGAPFLNDQSTMHEIMPSFIERCFRTVSARKWPAIGAFWRGVFRAWLTQYLRRDEGNDLSRVRLAFSPGVEYGPDRVRHRIAPESRGRTSRHLLAAYQPLSRTGE